MIIEKEGKRLTLAEFTSLTQTVWLRALDFDPKILPKVLKTCAKLQNRGEVPIEQSWFGKYFQKELTSKTDPDVVIRWIDSSLGWGVFAGRNFKAMEFIAEYVGRVRKRQRVDTQNSYCFEYILVPGTSSCFTVDAMDQGGVSRYINHSATPNLNSALASLELTTHIILHTNRAVAKDEQLCYDYGLDYWSKRTKPIPL